MTEKPTLLFVDDERQILLSLRALFRSEYRVFLANNADEALDLLRRQSIDIIVSDQRMPGMPGHELLRQVRKRSPATVRMLLTGYSDLSAIMNTINDGEVFRFIHKPWNNAELRATVRSAASIARQTRPSIYALESADTDGVIDLDPDFPPIDPEPPASVAALQSATVQVTAPLSPLNSAPAQPAPVQPASVQPTPALARGTAAPATAMETAAKRQTPAAAPEKDATPEGPAILVIDDQLETYNQLRGLFQQRHPLRLAHTLDKAIDILGQEEIAMLVTDVTIGGEDTTDFIKLLKQQYPAILALVITDAVDSDMAIELINQGRVFRYLRKPAGAGTLKLSVTQGMRFYRDNKLQPELVKLQQTETPTAKRSPSLLERLNTRLRSLGRRLSFSA